MSLALGDQHLSVAHRPPREYTLPLACAHQTTVVCQRPIEMSPSVTDASVAIGSDLRLGRPVGSPRLSNKVEKMQPRAGLHGASFVGQLQGSTELGGKTAEATRNPYAFHSDPEIVQPLMSMAQPVFSVTPLAARGRSANHLDGPVSAAGCVSRYQLRQIESHDPVVAHHVRTRNRTPSQLSIAGRPGESPLPAMAHRRSAVVRGQVLLVEITVRRLQYLARSRAVRIFIDQAVLVRAVMATCPLGP